MALFKSGKAKELSKLTGSKVRLIAANGQKNIAKGSAKKQEVNIIPKDSQSRKVVKTYEGGKLISKERQGHDILGRATTVQKKYVDGKKVSVVKRVAGNNIDKKVVKEIGKKTQVSESPAMPKMSSIGTSGYGSKIKQKSMSCGGDSKLLSTGSSIGGNCNKYYRKKKQQKL